jgi:DNA-binding PadR family transcriptional regulator
MSDLPKITHLQFLVLELLAPRPQMGRDLRGRLEDSGIRISRPAFYQLMLRLEDADYISGTYHTKVIDGQTIKEREYRVTPQGVGGFNSALDFYTRPRMLPGLAYA